MCYFGCSGILQFFFIVVTYFLCMCVGVYSIVFCVYVGILLFIPFVVTVLLSPCDDFVIHSCSRLEWVMNILGLSSRRIWRPTSSSRSSRIRGLLSWVGFSPLRGFTSCIAGCCGWVGWCCVRDIIGTWLDNISGIRVVLRCCRVGSISLWMFEVSWRALFVSVVPFFLCLVLCADMFLVEVGL